MNFKLSCLLLCYIFSKSIAFRELKMVYILTGNTYYSSDLITLAKNSEDEVIFGGDLSYSFLSLKTTNMPQVEKLRMYNLGSKFRQMYNNLLGQEYTYDKYTMYTTEFPVSMMSGLLINAGLWPPAANQKWNPKLNWQPIPYEYRNSDDDVLLQGSQCPNFQLELAAVSSDDQPNTVSSLYTYFINSVYNNSELQIYNPVDIIQLYHIFQSMLTDGKHLPSWLQHFYTNGTVYSLALEGYQKLSQTLLQKKLNGGTFLKKVLIDFQDVVTSTVTNNNAMIIFSGNDVNLAGVLADLKLESPPKPMSELAIMFELYFNNITKDYEISIKSQEKNVSKPVSFLKLADCNHNCSFVKFQQIIDDVIPDDEIKLCGRVVYETVIDIKETESISIETDSNFATTIKQNNFIILLTIFIIISNLIQLNISY